MKFNYQFKNCFGCVYSGGPVKFSQDSTTVTSSVGNRISHFDLKHCTTHSIDDVCTHTISHYDTSPDQFITVAVDEKGMASVVSNVNQSVIRRYDLRKPVTCVKFSPDGTLVAIALDEKVVVYHAPGTVAVYNPFKLHRLLVGCYGSTVTIDWSADSKLLIVGCEDSTSKVFAAEFIKEFYQYSLGGHQAPLIGCHFIDDTSADTYTISREGAVVHWECSHKLEAFTVYERFKKHEDVEDVAEGVPDSQNDETIIQDTKVSYRKNAKHFVHEMGSRDSDVTSTDYHRKSKILITGMSDGTFYLWEMPDFIQIHSLSVSTGEPVSAVSMSPLGDWVAIACETLGQLVVWEWQSETYVMRQQSHASQHVVSSVSFSPDEQFVATGSSDCKVKLWQFTSGFCFVTFSEHSAPVSDVTFDKSGKVVLSASLDGTVRAFDMKRYRNFRTLTSTRPAQFTSVAVDDTGDMVAAGTQDVFDVFVWSLKTGRLLEILTGHTSSVTSVQFSPITSLLVTASLDQFIRVWDVVISNKGSQEPIFIGTDVVALSVNPNGKEVAISTLKAQIMIIDHINNETKEIMDCRHDLGQGRGQADIITSRTMAKGRTFTCLCYSADGDFLLAGGHSKYVCVYNLQHMILFRRFTISQNQSLDRMSELLDRRRMTEFGNMDLVDQDTDTALALPGVRNRDLGERSYRAEIKVDQVKFSPTGRSWAAAGTEGVVLYSLDTETRFDPYQLTRDITPESVKSLLRQSNFQIALIHSLKLGDSSLAREVMEKTPVKDINAIVTFLPVVYVLKLVKFLISEVSESKHVEFYLLWSKAVLLTHRNAVKEMMPKSDLNAFNKALVSRYESLRQVCDAAKYSLAYTTTVCALQQARVADALENNPIDDDSDDSGVSEGMEI